MTLNSLTLTLSQEEREFPTPMRIKLLFPHRTAMRKKKKKDFFLFFDGEAVKKEKERFHMLASGCPKSSFHTSLMQMGEAKPPQPLLFRTLQPSCSYSYGLGLEIHGVYVCLTILIVAASIESNIMPQTHARRAQ